MKHTLLASLLMISSAVSLMIPTIASAGIFKCTDKAGKIYYNDKPCPTNQKEKKISAVKDPKNVYIPKLSPVATQINKVDKVTKKDDYEVFGTPQYKGKETAEQNASRIKHEKKMEERMEVEKEVVKQLEEHIEKFKEEGNTEKVELLTRVLSER